jgi:hypothetical protein
MTLKEFEHLSYELRLKEVRGGVCIGGRDEDQYAVLLYQLHSFYVELYWHREYCFVSALKGFDDTDRLDPYLESISLQHLLAR